MARRYDDLDEADCFETRGYIQQRRPRWKGPGQKNTHTPRNAEIYFKDDKAKPDLHFSLFLAVRPWQAQRPSYFLLFFFYVFFWWQPSLNPLEDICIFNCGFYAAAERRRWRSEANAPMWLMIGGAPALISTSSGFSVLPVTRSSSMYK